MPVTQQALKDLAAPIPADDIKKRPGPRGVILNYIDARTVFDRFDSVLGSENWATEAKGVAGGGILVGIGVSIARPGPTAKDAAAPEWVWKWDVGSPSDIEPIKGALSDGIKRAAVQWGFGRELYDQSDLIASGAGQAAYPPRQPVAQQAFTQYPQGTQASTTNGAAGGYPWSCPQGHGVKVVPGGFSQRTQKNYDPFYSCPVQGCPEKPPRGLPVNPAHLPQQAPYQPQYAVQQVPQPPEPQQVAVDFEAPQPDDLRDDGLPF